MTFDWPRKLRPPPREAIETREQKTVVINRKANRWPFGENTGLFGGSLMWVVEALAAAPPESCLYFQAFNDSFELPAGVQTTRSCQDRRAIAVPGWTDDLIDFLLEQRTTFSPSAEVLELHPNPRVSAVPLDKNLTFERAHCAFSGHFLWRPFVTDIVDDFCKHAGINKTETLGVHFRGTDKPGSAEAKEVEPELVIEAILDCFARRDHGFRFRSVFVATDEQPFADMLQDRLCKTLGAGVQFCALDDPTRVNDGARVPIHHRKSSIPSRDCLLYAAINMLVLSRCALVLKSPSALSCFAKIMEPALPLRLVNGFTQDWFPDGAVPLYRAYRADLDKRLAIVQNRRNWFRSTVSQVVKTLTSQNALYR
jgi:hypothetical protein